MTRARLSSCALLAAACAASACTVVLGLDGDKRFDGSGGAAATTAIGSASSGANGSAPSASASVAPSSSTQTNVGSGSGSGGGMCGTSGCTSLVVDAAKYSSITAIAADDSYLAFVDGGAVYRTPIDAIAAPNMSPVGAVPVQSTITSVAVTPSGVAWSYSDTAPSTYVEQYPGDQVVWSDPGDAIGFLSLRTNLLVFWAHDPKGAEIASVDKNAFMPIPLSQDPTSFTADATTLYWTNIDGSVFYDDGASPQTIVGAGGLAADNIATTPLGDFVAWTSDSGSIGEYRKSTKTASISSGEVITGVVSTSMDDEHLYLAEASAGCTLMSGAIHRLPLSDLDSPAPDLPIAGDCPVKVVATSKYVFWLGASGVQRYVK